TENGAGAAGLLTGTPDRAEGRTCADPHGCRSVLRGGRSRRPAGPAGRLPRLSSMAESGPLRSLTAGHGVRRPTFAVPLPRYRHPYGRAARGGGRLPRQRAAGRLGPSAGPEALLEPPGAAQAPPSSARKAWGRRPEQTGSYARLGSSHGGWQSG